MEKEAWRLLRTLSAKIPSVRIPIASLSGGQRQTVAIARSLVGKPKVVMLDEPTAALGVAQTAEVLNLIERLRETGLGVILISHNMADVQAVADRIVVLRLGRNAAEFRVEEATTAELVAAITGASDNVVTERASRTARAHEAASAGRRAAPMADTETRDAAATSVAADLADERLIRTPGPRRLPARPGHPAPVRRPRQPAGRHRAGRHLLRRSTSTTCGSCRRATSCRSPSTPPRSASSRSASCWCCCSAQIDLSVGSVSGMAAAVMAVLMVNQGMSTFVSMLGGDPHRRGRRGSLRPAVHAHRRAVVRLLAGRAARLPGRAALRARRQRHDQPAQRLLPAGVHPVQLRHRLGVLRDRGPDRGRLPRLAVADQPAAQGRRARAAVVAAGADQGGAARGRSRASSPTTSTSTAA